MHNILMTATKSYRDENNTPKQISYTLVSRSASIGTLYDISCACADGRCETYPAVTDSRSDAVKIFDEIVSNIVGPEHLICIIDDMCDGL